MNEQRRSGHTVTRFTAHLVWVTKYRYPVLKGDIKKRCRELIIQVCDAEDVQILKGVVSKDHVHMHIEYPPKITEEMVQEYLEHHRDPSNKDSGSMVLE
ncbi:putative transposase [Bathymodiolus japonicus methanotrophic gill symbiont]|uniref:IS200/IS605 family transposase n=1 Tax=Bathymodiolus japonicus methanotrophic gill symbiont TaxID=113269 RepID=UPI001B57A16B|nr:IS200/IS605 family transposase [Bathymodiolus japonicus methanotrophic gill symbiont]GFO73513.1 putative transposase [Bathymodiolus japonicus methanotrophic gill symbiont]